SLMYNTEICQQVIQKFPDVTMIPVPEKYVRDPEPQVRVPSAKLVEVCKFLKSSPEFAFDFPIQMTAIDYIKDNLFALVYFLYSSKKKHGIILKSQISRASAEIDSVTPIWSGMDWQ